MVDITMTGRPTESGAGMTEEWLTAGGLTSYEIKVLEMLAGRREIPWGAWVGACLECLAGRGYCSRVHPRKITNAGRAYLFNRDGNKEGGGLLW